MKLSNCITDDIAICINDDMQIQSAYLCFKDFLIFNAFINIHENANYVDKIICICHKLIKGQCLSFNLIPNLVGCDKKQLRY